MEAGSIASYYEEILKYPLLTAEEERDLFCLLNDEGLPQKERDNIRNRIIKANLRYPFKKAKEFSKGDEETFYQLIAAGNEGLLVAMEKFKPELGFRFLTYAGWWVLQRILKEMSTMRIVSLPVSKQQLAQKIHELQSQQERPLTMEELKRNFPNAKEKDLRELSETKYLTYYIEDIGDNPQFEIDPIGTEVETRIDRERIHSAISKLPEKHSQIIMMTFGLDDGDEKKQSDISKELGLSRAELREYKKEALEMLREALADHQPD